MDKHKSINRDLVILVENELGQKTADLYSDFYDGFPLQEQIEGAREILNEIVGRERTDELLKRVKTKNEIF